MMKQETNDFRRRNQTWAPSVKLRWTLALDFGSLDLGLGDRGFWTWIWLSLHEEIFAI